MLLTLTPQNNKFNIRCSHGFIHLDFGTFSFLWQQRGVKTSRGFYTTRAWTQPEAIALLPTRTPARPHAECHNIYYFSYVNRFEKHATFHCFVWRKWKRPLFPLNLQQLDVNSSQTFPRKVFTGVTSMWWFSKCTAVYKSILNISKA